MINFDDVDCKIQNDWCYVASSSEMKNYITDCRVILSSQFLALSSEVWTVEVGKINQRIQKLKRDLLKAELSLKFDHKVPNAMRRYCLLHIKKIGITFSFCSKIASKFEANCEVIQSFSRSIFFCRRSDSKHQHRQKEKLLNDRSVLP
jgi:hypothetical protein